MSFGAVKRRSMCVRENFGAAGVLRLPKRFAARRAARCLKSGSRISGDRNVLQHAEKAEYVRSGKFRSRRDACRLSRPCDEESDILRWLVPIEVFFCFVRILYGRKLRENRRFETAICAPCRTKPGSKPAKALFFRRVSKILYCKASKIMLI